MSQADETPQRRADITVSPEPTPLEMAAILVAHEALWPKPAAVSAPERKIPRWRFSGRWWLDSELRPFR